MVPLWAVLIPAALLLTYLVLAFETRPRVLWLLTGLCVLGVAIAVITGLIRW